MDSSAGPVVNIYIFWRFQFSSLVTVPCSRGPGKPMPGSHLWLDADDWAIYKEMVSSNYWWWWAKMMSWTIFRRNFEHISVKSNISPPSTHCLSNSPLTVPPSHVMSHLLFITKRNTRSQLSEEWRVVQKLHPISITFQVFTNTSANQSNLLPIDCQLCVIATAIWQNSARTKFHPS